jgi:hypothetical protein
MRIASFALVMAPLTLALAVAASSIAIAQATATEPCAYDRTAALAMSRDAFDQDANGGWRALSKVPGCEVAAAELIAAYRAAHPQSPSGLYWHEGQVRANIGDYERAAALFGQSKGQDVAWNLYVDGSIAFLRKDRPGMDRALHDLAAIPQPPWFADTAADVLKRMGVKITWPENLPVLEKLSLCFDKTYLEAYGGGCQEKPAEP